MADPTDPRWLAALATSQVLWAVAHVAVVSVFRDRLIDRLGEQRYSAAFAVTSLGWLLGNTLLLDWIEPGAPLLSAPAALGVVETVVRLTGYLLLLNEAPTRIGGIVRQFDAVQSPLALGFCSGSP